jgi:tripartite-type tricarboxylate transporter receptor subunit TctC
MYVYARIKQSLEYKTNTKKIHEFVRAIKLNVDNGMKFNEAIKNTFRNIDIRENLKKISILMAAIDILKNNTNVDDILKEDIKRTIEYMKKYGVLPK